MIDHEQICCSLTSVSLVKLAVFIASSSMSNQFSFFSLKGGPEVHIHWKGAAEIILDSCTSWLDTDGSKHSMTPEKVIYCSTF